MSVYLLLFFGNLLIEKFRIHFSFDIFLFQLGYIAKWSQEKEMEEERKKERLKFLDLYQGWCRSIEATTIKKIPLGAACKTKLKSIKI